MKIPLLSYLASAAEALPMIVAAVTRRPVRGARGWIVAWTVAHIFVANAALLLALHHRPNLKLSGLTAPVTVAILLWGLSCLQDGEVARLTVRLVAGAALVVWAVLTAVFEDTSTFSRAAEPMLNLVVLGVAASTLLLRSRTSRAGLFDQDWFWISAGIALFFATWSAVGPLSSLLLGASPAVFDWAYRVVGVLAILAMVLIARGMACPVES